MTPTMGDLPKEDARDGSNHLIWLVKGCERYVWRWDDDRFLAAVQSVMSFARNNELSFTVDESMHVMRRMTQMDRESESDKLPR